MATAELYRILEQQLVSPKQENTIMVKLTGHVYEVSDQFLSVTIDAGAIRHNCDIIYFTATRIINMAKAQALGLETHLKILSCLKKQLKKKKFS